ncbi:ATP-binding cassette domain-containing protein [Microbacterium sp.]|uniref:ABC transporter ATP-binding protein/permease n=1 Tax=Microbacterium sp. TaxID=51671 RepID=UPI003A89BFCF
MRLRAVTRTYAGPPSVRALRGVDLSIAEGEIVAIEGPSGGGKSTLLNILGLLDHPTDGDVIVAGRSVTGDNDRALSATRSDMFGFVFQGFHLLDRRPVFESVELALMYRGVPLKQRRQLAAEALETVGLGGYGPRLAYELSGGQRQRVAIARALSTGAPILIADEPTGNLDSANAEQVVDALHVANQSGATVVIVTHSPDVAATARRRITIRDGQLSGTAIGPGDAAHARDSDTNVMRSGVQVGRPSQLRLRDLIDDAVSGLASKLIRTIALIAAVALGVGLTIATIGVSDSARAQVASTFDRQLNRDVTVAWEEPALSGLSPEFINDAAGRVAALKGVEHVGILTIERESKIWTAVDQEPLYPNGYAITNDVIPAARLDVTWVPNHAPELAPGEALIGTALASQLGLGPLIVEPTVYLADRSVTIVGVISDSPRLPQLLGAVVFPAADAQPSGETSIIIRTSPGAAQQVARQAPLAINYFDPDSLTVDAPPDPRTLRGEIESSVQVTLLIVSGIALLGAIASLANAMVLAITERSREIGLRRALGARRHDISGLIMIEAAIMGFVGGLAGLTLGLLGILAFTITQGWLPVFDLRLAGLAIAGGMIVGILGGTAAASRAARIQPADALRQ